MKIGYFPDLKAIVRSSSLRPAVVKRGYGVKLAARNTGENQPLTIDENTEKDLEIFAAESYGRSLYELCNRTVTQGGAQLLRHRMENPFSDSASILGAQEAVTFITRHRKIFRSLGFWITGRVERYHGDPLMLVTHRNAFGFLLGAVSMKLFDNHHYFRIMRGVTYACMLVQSVRKFLASIDAHSLSGELAAICEEIEAILYDEDIQMVPETEPKGAMFWVVLRLDQIFRIYRKEKIQQLLRLIYEIDALVSMADATVGLNYRIPEILEGPVRVDGEGLVHPQVDNPVPNDFRLDQTGRLLFLTGPNMAGKTTFLRAIATSLYFGHLGMGVPAVRFAFTPVDQLFTSFSINDNVHTGTSYFFAEVLRIKSVAAAIAEGKRVVAILDEPFKGTNVLDAIEASYAVMKRLEEKSDCLFLISSHLIELDERFCNSGNITRCYFEAEEDRGRLRFDYRIHSGVSSQRLGMRVLAEAGVFALLDQRSG